MIFTIARREVRSLFSSPLAWATLTVVQIVAALIFALQVEYFIGIEGRLTGAQGVTDIVVPPLFFWTSVVLLVIMPPLTMRLFSAEQRSGTLMLLMSAPVGISEIVIGKFLAMFAFILIAVGMVSMMPFALLAAAPVDLGKIFSGLIGLTLIVSAFAAIGLYMSSLTRQPAIAAAGTYGVLMLLWVFYLLANQSLTFRWLSLVSHLGRLLSGLMNSLDVAYYLLIIAVFIILTIRRIDGDRLRR